MNKKNILVPIILFLSVLAGFLAWPAIVPLPALTHDTSVYINVAQNLSRFGRLEMNTALTTSNETSRRMCMYMPGYPATIAVLFWLGVSESIAIPGLTLLGFIANVALSFLLIFRLTRHIWLSSIFSLIIIAWKPIFNYMTYALTESLFIPVSLAVLLIMIDLLKSKRYKITNLVVLSVLLAYLIQIRILGLVLVACVGLTFFLKAFVSHQWKEFLKICAAIGLSMVPMVLVLLENYRVSGSFYCATNSAGWDIPRSSAGWLANTLVADFIPDLNLGLGFRRLANMLPWQVWAVLAILLVGASLWATWKQRTKLWQAVKSFLSWPIFTIILFIIVYLGLFFIQPNIWAQWDFPRYFLPVYPLILIVIFTAAAVIMSQFRSMIVRIVLLVMAAIYLVSTWQTLNAYFPVIKAGRGIESQEILHHPAIGWLKNNYQENDQIFSTRETTIWYYLRLPARRFMGMNELTCSQLPSPVGTGRSLFVIFPESNYQGNPIDPQNMAFLKSWLEPCGKIIDQQILNDAAVYILESSSIRR